jgi:hypothetical protein
MSATIGAIEQARAEIMFVHSGGFVADRISAAKVS